MRQPIRPFCASPPSADSLPWWTSCSLGNLYNVQRRREAACAKTDAKLWTATTWLREHQREFKAIVYDPIRLLVSAKEPKYAKLAEAAINYTTMKVGHASIQRLDFAQAATLVVRLSSVSNTPTMKD